MTRNKISNRYLEMNTVGLVWISTPLIRFQCTLIEFEVSHKRDENLSYLIIYHYTKLPMILRMEKVLKVDVTEDFKSSSIGKDDQRGKRRIF